ncbi:hypothetical protein BKA93DRAFT_796690 [Sparassis latifolia]
MVANSPVHPASLLDPTLHSPALLQMLGMDISRDLIEYLVDTVVETVDYALGRASSSRGRSLSRHTEHTKFTRFVTDVIAKAEVPVPVLLTTLVYVHRAKPHIQIALEQWACERVFLGALIVANKYLNDSTLKNVHWALCTGVFGKRDIGRIEREFLDVLDFELGVSEADLLAHHSALVGAHPHHHHHHHHIRVREPSRSRWSDNSSETDVDMDSESSFETSSGPRTPAHAHVAVYPVKASLSHSPSPSHPQRDAVQIHPQVSTALSLFHGLPVPSFSLPRAKSMFSHSTAVSRPGPAATGCRPHQSFGTRPITTQVMA